MEVTCEVHIPQAAVPPIGIVHDWDTQISMVLSYNASTQEWVPGHGVSGSYPPVVARLPDCFTLDPRITQVLNKRLEQERALAAARKGIDLRPDKITEPLPVPADAVLVEVDVVAEVG